jgi:uncharacterized protein YoxC
MVLEVEFGIMAGALAVLAAFSVPVLIRLRRAAEEAERLLRLLNGAVPPFLQAASEGIRVANSAVRNVRYATAGVYSFGVAVRDVGATVDQVNQLLRNGTETLRMTVLSNAAGVLAGVRTAMLAVKERLTRPSELCGPVERHVRKFRSP